MKTWSEHRVISIIKDILRPVLAKGAHDLLDDGASLPSCPKGYTRVVSCDAITEKTDFIVHPLSPVGSAGHRAIIQNLSDLSAMGAKPVGFVWSLEIPNHWLSLRAKLLREFCQGVVKTCLHKKLEFYGGDLSFSQNQFSCAITVFGDVKRKPLNRRGAKPGDYLFLSRPVGASKAGLEELLNTGCQIKSGMTKTLINTHIYPDNESTLGPNLVGVASACMDISDGFSQDLYRLCEASNVSALVSNLADAIDPRISHFANAKELALTSGEEYALLVTVPAQKIQKLKNQLKDHRLIQVGKIIASQESKSKVYLETDKKRVLLKKTGYDHFSSFSLGQTPL